MMQARIEPWGSLFTATGGEFVGRPGQAAIRRLKTKPARGLEKQQDWLRRAWLELQTIPDLDDDRKADWRSFDTLANAFGANEKTAKRLRTKIGAHRSTGQGDAWAVIKNPPVIRAKKDGDF